MKIAHIIKSVIDVWQDGYGAFTYSFKEKDRLIQYVKNQRGHHKVKSFKEEFIELLREHEIEFDEKYLLSFNFL
ncbi:MAG: hypothetical protein ACP5DZ_03890 [Bacteroidales bacterium]